MSTIQEVRLKVSDKAWIVAQICNQLYRRFAIGRLSYDLRSFVLGDVQQNKILRYSRLENLRYFLRKMTFNRTDTGNTGGEPYCRPAKEGFV
jgi:hypothetical protein